MNLIATYRDRKDQGRLTKGFQVHFICKYDPFIKSVQRSAFEEKHRRSESALTSSYIQYEGATSQSNWIEIVID